MPYTHKNTSSFYPFEKPVPSYHVDELLVGVYRKEDKTHC